MIELHRLETSNYCAAGRSGPLLSITDLLAHKLERGTGPAFGMPALESPPSGLAPAGRYPRGWLRMTHCHNMSAAPRGIANAGEISRRR